MYSDRVPQHGRHVASTAPGLVSRAAIEQAASEDADYSALVLNRQKPHVTVPPDRISASEAGLLNAAHPCAGVPANRFVSAPIPVPVNTRALRRREDLPGVVIPAKYLTAPQAGLLPRIDACARIPATVALKAARMDASWIPVPEFSWLLAVRPVGSQPSLASAPVAAPARDLAMTMVDRFPRPPAEEDRFSRGVRGRLRVVNPDPSPFSDEHAVAETPLNANYPPLQPESSRTNAVAGPSNVNRNAVAQWAVDVLQDYEAPAADVTLAEMGLMPADHEWADMPMSKLTDRPTVTVRLDRQPPSGG